MNGIAISGKAGAGKNAFATVLAEALVERGQWPTDIAFADELKRQLWVRYGMVKGDPGGREMLFKIGKELRGGDIDFFVKHLAGVVGSLIPYGVSPIITDLRYLNEYEWCKANGFVLVRVDATFLDRTLALSSRGEDPVLASSEHPAECDLDEEFFHVRFGNEHGRMAPMFTAAFLSMELLDDEVEVWPSYEC